MSYKTKSNRMKKDRSFTDSSKITAVRLPDRLDAEAREKCRAEDLTFSQLMRRALRRELSQKSNSEAA
jgi:hypothetical protein